MKSLLRQILGLGNAIVIEGVRFEEETDSVIVEVRPRKTTQLRCGRCGTASSRFDRGEGRRRWRSLDAGVIRVWLEADAPRVACRGCGPTVAQVPWARHGAGHTRAFDDTVAWLVTRTSKSAVTELMRVAWDRSSLGSRPISRRRSIGSRGSVGSGSTKCPIRSVTSI